MSACVCQGSVTHVIHGFCDSATYTPVMSCFMWVCGFECARAVRSLICVPCFVLECGVWIPALSVSCWSSDTHTPCVHLSRFGSMRSRVRSAACSSVHVCCVLLCCTQFMFYLLLEFMLYLVLCGTARSLFFSWAACFHVVMSCVNTWLMSILISCVFVSCFAHGWWFVLLAMCLWFCCMWAHGFVLVFCVPCALMSICLDPTHLISWLLVNLPHLSFLVTLLICSLYNLLVFAVLCWIFLACCPALPSCPVFPYGGFCLFVLFKFLQIKSHLLHHWVLASSLHSQPWQCRLALSNFCSDCLRWQPWIIYLYLYKYYYI